MLLLYVLSVIFEYVIFRAFLFRFFLFFFMSICSVVSSNIKSKTETTSLRSAQDTNQLSWWICILLIVEEWNWACLLRCSVIRLC